jgi:phage baseplate assembly protein gpV
VLGGAYSDADAPPTENAEEIHLRGASGAGLVLNLATGEITIDGAASVRIAAGEIVLDGPVSMPQGLTAGSGEGTAATFAGAITADGRIESKTEVVAPNMSPV